MCSAPWYAASSPPRNASTAGATAAIADSSSRAIGRSPDSRRTRTNAAAPSIEASVRGLSSGSFAAGSFALICGSSSNASARRAGPRRTGLSIRDAWSRFRAEATSILPSSFRIAHAHECGPCTSTPFGRAMPPSLIFSFAIAAKGSGSGEDCVRRVAQPADAELEVGDRDPLVGGMDERRGDFGSQLARPREASVGHGAERLAQPVAVGEAHTRERGSPRSRLGSGNPLVERLPQGRIERGASAAARLDPFELVLDVSAEHRPDHRLDVLRVLAGQKPAVDRDLAQ